MGQLDPERTLPHEVSHHLEQHLPKADRDALHREYEAQKKEYSGYISAALKVMMDDDRPLREDGKPEEFTEGQRKLLADTYRFKDFSEFFAESMADRALCDAYGDNLPASRRPLWERLTEAAKGIMGALHDALIRKGDRKAADRIYQKFLKGEYEPGGGASEVSQDTKEYNPLRAVAVATNAAGRKYREATANLRDASANLKPTLDHVDATVTKFGKVADDADAFIKGDGLAQLSDLIGEMRRLVVSLTKFSDQLNHDPTKLLFGDRRKGYQPK